MQLLKAWSCARRVATRVRTHSVVDGRNAANKLVVSVLVLTAVEDVLLRGLRTARTRYRSNGAAHRHNNRDAQRGGLTDDFHGIYEGIERARSMCW